MSLVNEPVLSKRQNFRLWQSGAFGNKLRAWPTITDWEESNYYGPVVLRVLTRECGGPCAFDIPRFAVRDTRHSIKFRDYPDDAIMVNEMAPNHFVRLQGEYANEILAGHAGYFFHSRLAGVMPAALRVCGAHAFGLAADLMIREAMAPASYEDWRMLLDQYPNHVLEVSIFDRCLGDIPGRNALVWEVRRY